MLLDNPGKPSQSSPEWSVSNRSMHPIVADSRLQSVAFDGDDRAFIYLSPSTL